MKMARNGTRLIACVALALLAGCAAAHAGDASAAPVKHEAKDEGAEATAGKKPPSKPGVFLGKDEFVAEVKTMCSFCDSLVKDGQDSCLPDIKNPHPVTGCSYPPCPNGSTRTDDGQRKIQCAGCRAVCPFEAKPMPGK